MTVPESSSMPRTLGSTPIRDLGLAIGGTRLEPIIAQFRRELERVGIRRLQPDFYLSTEWGVPFGTICIAIPFYLATPELTTLHAERHGHVEGDSPHEILRYLRHEMGHVINYGYQLYDDEDWVKHFGSITQPYEEEYRPELFSRDFVQHLPGWYAQKHPDEDWSETFAVWMTPERDWRGEYADWPKALQKLEHCDHVMKRLGDREPVVTVTEPHEDVGGLGYSLDEYYDSSGQQGLQLPPGLDGALRAIFEDIDLAQDHHVAERLSAADLIRRLERDLMANVYRWTGHFPERTRLLVRHLADRAAELKQVYPTDKEPLATVAVTTLVTALAMNHVIRGRYLP
jgi:hypothetical protein